MVRDFCGHGIGRRFHEAPNILHFGKPGDGPVLRPGMFFTIEPMVNAGRPEVKVLDDGWTAVTRDRSLSSQFEHMVGVTEDGVRGLHHLARGVAQAAVLLMAPFVTTHRLRFNDTDRLGHVNNAVFAVMLEQGRSELADLAGLPVEGSEQAVVIVRLELDFLKEMAWPGDVRVETEVVRLGGRSFTLGQRLVHQDELCARALTVLVVMDRAARRAVPVEPWRASLERWLAPER